MFASTMKTSLESNMDLVIFPSDSFLKVICGGMMRLVRMFFGQPHQTHRTGCVRKTKELQLVGCHRFILLSLF